MKTERIGDALIVRLGDLTRVIPTSGQPYFVSGDGLVGIDDDDHDKVVWYRITATGPKIVRTVATTDPMFDLLQAVVDEGLRLMGRGRG